LTFARPSSTWLVIHHESGAMSSNYIASVSLLWQLKHAATANWRVRGVSHAGSCRTGGFDTRVRDELDGGEHHDETDPRVQGNRFIPGPVP
jgi:hypothetical protein